MVTNFKLVDEINFNSSSFGEINLSPNYYFWSLSAKLFLWGDGVEPDEHNKEQITI